MFGEILIHLRSAGRLADGGVFSLGVAVRAGLWIPREAALHMLLYSRLAFGCHPQCEELPGRRTGAPFKDMDALGEIKRIRIGESQRDRRALFDDTKRRAEIDAAEKRVFTGRHFLQTFGLSRDQDRFVLNDPL